MSAALEVEEADYRDACESSMGWCTACEAFTRECTEPDAENYDCPECGKNTVMGAEEALINGQFELIEDR